MRLKKIKLAGFKSFVDPTTIPFPDDMTAIVGPNGCGKSNVIDAVRWVLGESSAKNLRGDAMTDVIFNGSTGRSAVSQCSVELVFDNSSGRIQGEYAGYNELSVKRIVTKDAQSSYLLNNSKCRRRDVTDLFLGTGLGPRSYAIIEQGMISRLIESKPQELRMFIEEAAGISKYKERRRETETRIRHTKENLERLEDVRGELGQQLEKLQRQATAARRFKELKHSERKYKGELAALRWLKHNQNIERLQHSIAQKESDLESYIAQQRGGEKGIVEHKERQQNLKQQLHEIQQICFKLGTDITRLEQNQIHAKQRRQQIEKELASLQNAISESETHNQQSLERIEVLQHQITKSEPEQALLDEQLVQAQEALYAADDELNRQQAQWRQEALEYNQLKQQVQSRHGQVQSTMNMQMRTQMRISELQQEQGELQDNQVNQNIADCEQKLEGLEADHQINQESEQQALETQQQRQADLRQQEQFRLAAQGKVQSIEAQISALQALQELQKNDGELQAYLQQHDMPSQPWWQTLEIKDGWEIAFETVTAHWRNAQVIDALGPDHMGEHLGLCHIAGSRLLFADLMSTDKVEGSLAAKLHNNSFPVWLSHIQLAPSLEEALIELPLLAEHQSIVTQQGCWLGQGWLVSACTEQESGQLLRVNQLKLLEQQITIAQDELVQAEHALDRAQQQQKNSQAQWQRVSEVLRQSQQTLSQEQNQRRLLQQQQIHNSGRRDKLEQELQRQQAVFADEKQQLEELAMQLEEQEFAMAELHEQQGQIERNREKAQQQLGDHRAKVDTLKNQLHQGALQLQSVRSQYQGLLSAQQREQQQLTQMQEKQTGFSQELTQQTMPLKEQGALLESLLEQRGDTELQQRHVSEALAKVDTFLAEAEKGQQGINDKIQQMQAELQSINLECEGFRVRANGVLEQLNEMQQSLKPILEELSDRANEQQWQLLLEKTTAAVSRLGAVNLAAVEEYDMQAQRKQHLDEQNEDLCSALETLEQAIRKIDKETRARFKDTFEQVNEGLKTLFPKVFGGGSAYLALTDNDLLETGVSIMARPPGKKNSTIHLLSGGEKALTALSLVFAIFRLNPAPFCLLDEVDAPLDDANVERFCKLVLEMSKSVQFIFITHNKIAMEMATHLTGVTMAEPGVSRMVAVDVDQAIAIAQA
jgi:chromosome segregation protein